MANLNVTGNITINNTRIAESSSNSNGYCIRLFDGTRKIQLCSNALNNEGTATFPRPFSSVPNVICGIINSSSSSQISYRTMSAYDISTTGFNFQLTGSTAKTYIAIGEWL